MNIISALVGLSIMGAASPVMLDMSLAPIIAQKRAQNLGIAESAAVTFAAANEGQTQLTGSTPDGCEVAEISNLAYKITCIKGEGTNYVQSVTRAFRLATEDLSCDDNDGNNGHGNSDGYDCSNPGNSGYAGDVRVFDFPAPPGFTDHQCGITENWGLDSAAFDRKKNKWKGESCIPGDIWHRDFYTNSDPNAWMYDVNGHNGYGPHPDY
jgi:hypothetical protein